MSLMFHSIPVDLLTPGAYVEFDASRAIAGLVNQRHKSLIIGQRLAAGTVAALVPVRVDSVAIAQQSFGLGSQLALMAQAYKSQDETVEVWAVALDDDVASIAAIGTLVWTGPATAAGVIQLYVIGQRLSISVASGATATQIATDVAAAINASVSLPITAAAATGTVTMTARNKGEVGNCIDVRVNYRQGDKLPAGVGVTIVCPEDGVLNPDITPALAAVGDDQYLTLVMPYTDATNLTTMESELAERWEGLNRNDGHCFTFVPGTLSDGSTLGDSRNSPHVTIIGTQTSPTWGPVLASQVAAADAAESDPARPRQTLVLEDVLPPSVTDRYTRAERQIHLQDGIATYTIDSGGLARIERLVTTYKTNAQGVADASYRDIETLRSLSYIRFQVVARVSTVFPRHKLGSDTGQYGAGQKVATPRTIRSEMISLFRDLETAGIIEDLDSFKDELLVMVNATDPNRADVLLPPNLVNQLRVFAAQIQFRI